MEHNHIEEVFICINKNLYLFPEALCTIFGIPCISQIFLFFQIILCVLSHIHMLTILHVFFFHTYIHSKHTLG